MLAIIVKQYREKQKKQKQKKKRNDLYQEERGKRDDVVVSWRGCLKIYTPGCPALPLPPICTVLYSKPKLTEKSSMKLLIDATIPASLNTSKVGISFLIFPFLIF